MTKSRGILAPRHKWTAQEIATLRRRYPDERTADIARDLGIAVHLVYARANNLGLKKSAAFYASSKSGRILRGGTLSVATQFQPGQIPHNKGLRRPGWFSGRMRETQFRKGQINGRARDLYQPVGSYRVNADGLLDQKVRDDGPPQKRWVGVHRLVWMREKGPIPPGHVVVFKPGRHTTKPEEITIDALELITRSELGRRNSPWAKYPRELAELIQLKGVIHRQINRRIRDAKQDG